MYQRSSCTKKSCKCILVSPKGSRSKKVKLTGKQEETKKLLDKTISKSAIGRILGVHRLTVHDFMKNHWEEKKEKIA